MAAKSDGSSCKEYLCLLAQEHVNFRITELKSIASIFGIELKFIDDQNKIGPFLRIQMQSECQARQLLSRSMSIRSMYELWATGSSLTDVCTALKNCPYQCMQPYCTSDTSYRINIETYNKKIPQCQREEYYEALSFLPLEGKVNLDKPDQVFSLLLDFGDDNNTASSEPCRLFFGRLLGKGQRHLAQKYSLSKRHFIGNTSMDPLLSFLMANQGKARPGTLVFDPFVGTGSIILACSEFGAHVIGSDIDRNLLQGRGKSSRANCKWKARDEVIRTNFRHAGLEHLFVDSVIADASRHVLRATPIFDAIITDPPYGVREGVRKLEADTNSTEAPHPAIRLGRLSDVILSLLHFSSHYLTLHGRLVFWLPVHKPSYSDAHAPQHPCLTLVANSEQSLFKHISRRLITIEKVKQPEDTITMDSLTKLNAGFQTMCDNFRENYFSSPDER